MTRARHADDIWRHGRSGDAPARTALERLIWERRESFEEFAESVETFAREHGERGTLSARHVQRLAAGRYPDGRPLGPVRPATARLLERMLGLGIDELLAPPDQPPAPHTFRIAIALVLRESSVLAVNRRGPEPSGISWQFPAGVVKPGASAEETAIRETLNETGVHCAVVRRLGSRLHPVTHVICDYLLCDYLAGDAMNADPDENAGVAWIERSTVTKVIPAEQIFPPVLGVLQPIVPPPL